MSLRSIWAVVAAAWLVGVPMANASPPYPDRPIKLILPFPAGGATDGAARYVADELRKSLGQPVVVENMAGADSIIAAQNVKRAAADGYTLLMSTNSAHGANRSLYNTLPYDPEKNFEPVAGVIRIPLTLVVKKDFPADDVASFVKVAQQRAANKPLNFGSGNTSSQLGGALLNSAIKAEMTHVPYRGTPQALQDLMGGQIDMLVVDPFSSMGFVSAGQLKVLGVADRVRHPLPPQVPTMAEAGYKNVEIVTWAAVFAPAKTDQAIVHRRNREINKILSRPEAREAVLKMAMTPMIMSPSLSPNAPNRTAYAASKGGALNLTRALAAELASAVRANCVCPGLVDTPMAEGVHGNVGNYALQRLAQPEEIAQAILFLTSAESSYVTGAALAVDGGRSFH